MNANSSKATDPAVQAAEQIRASGIVGAEHIAKRVESKVAAISTEAASEAKRTPEQLRADIEKTRAELVATVTELSIRTTPKYQATKVKQVVKTAAADAKSLLTGNGLPADAPKRARNAKVLLSTASATVALTAWKIAQTIYRTKHR